MVESSYNTDYYGEEDNKKPSFINKIKLASGGLSLVASIIILLSLVSYLFTGFDDQSLINSGLSIDSLGKEAKNWLGIVGAYTSHYLIFEVFGRVGPIAKLVKFNNTTREIQEEASNCPFLIQQLFSQYTDLKILAPRKFESLQTENNEKCKNLLKKAKKYIGG